MSRRCRRAYRLTDDDRWPWLDLDRRSLSARRVRAPQGLVVISCSALKKSYRDRLRHAAGGPLPFVFLEGSRVAAAAARTRASGHFMPAGAARQPVCSAGTSRRREAGVSPWISTRRSDSIADAALEGPGRLWDRSARIKERGSAEMTQAANVAVIGAGIMGSAIATRLIETGHAVTVFDLDTAKVAALTRRARLPRLGRRGNAGACRRFVILSLNHADIVRAVVFGDGGVAAAASCRQAADRHVLDRPGRHRRHGEEARGRDRHGMGRLPAFGRRARRAGRTADRHGGRRAARLRTRAHGDAASLRQLHADGAEPAQGRRPS